MMKKMTMRTKKSSVNIAATPIKKPTRSSEALPPNTTEPAMPVKVITRNIDQIAANVALL